jgi:hypothetical protein
MVSITELFFDYLPYSLLIIIVPVVIIWFWKREKTEQIINQVAVFFKGGTWAFYPCTVGKGEITFDIEDSNYTEPITVHPRLGMIGGKMKRTYLFSEGIGLIDVPPLTREDKEKILKHLVDANVIESDSDLEKKSIDDWTEMDLMQYIKYYQFDIEQVLDKPMANAWKETGRALASSVDRISQRNRQMDTSGQTSNVAKLGYIVVGILIGAGFAWAFALKGYI